MACYHDETGDFGASNVSDFLSRAEFRRREIYWEFFHPWGVEYELSVRLDAPLSHAKMFVFDRAGGRDFSERDRDVLDVLRPHLARIYETAKLRRTAHEALTLLERTHAALVVLEGADRVAYATPRRSACWRPTFTRAEAVYRTKSQNGSASSDWPLSPRRWRSNEASSPSSSSS